MDAKVSALAFPPSEYQVAYHHAWQTKNMNKERTCGRWNTSTTFSLCSIVCSILNERGRAIPWIILHPERSSQGSVQGVATPFDPNRSNAGKTRVSRVCDSKYANRMLCSFDFNMPSVRSECSVGVGTKSMSFRKTNTPDGTCIGTVLRTLW